VTPEDLDAMTTEEQFDYLRLNTDHTLALLIDRLEERWLLASSAAKLWFAATADDVRREQTRLDREAVESEHRLG